MTTLRLLPELEDELRRLPGVRAASVVTGPDADPVEIHVVASRAKAAKQVVRDVQSLAMAQFDLDIDHRIVSVVQFDDELIPTSNGNLVVLPDGDIEPVVEPAPPRPVITAISVRTAGSEADVSVVVSSAEASFEGRSIGSAAMSYRHTLVARATLDAVGELLGIPAEVEHAAIVALGNRQMAACVIQIVVPRVGELVVTGSALVRGDEADAVARSVLDALNRRLTG